MLNMESQVSDNQEEYPIGVNFRTKAGWFKLICDIILVIMVVGLVMNRVQSTIGHEQLVSATLIQKASIFFLSLLSPAFWLRIFTPACYISALFFASRVFSKIEKGEEFSEAMLVGLDQMCRYLGLGASANLFIIPVVASFFEPKFAPVFHISFESLTILMVAVIIGFLVKQARYVRNELESIV